MCSHYFHTSSERGDNMSISTQYKHNKPICDTGERVIPCKDCPTGSRNLLNLYTVNPKADAALI